VTVYRGGGDLRGDRGLHLGDGLFETVLVRDGSPRFLAEHLARMRRSADALGLRVPEAFREWIDAEVPGAWAEAGRPGRAALRVVLTRGVWEGLEPADGAPPGVVLALRPLDEEPPATRTAVVVDAPRIDPSHPLAGHKTLSWMAQVEARRRARAAGADVALLRTIEGDVAEADAANVFVVVDGAPATPPVDRGVLPGVTRAQVLGAARALGMAAQERRLTEADLSAATEVFLTSSLAGVVGVTRIGDRALPTAAPVTGAVRTALSEGTGPTSATSRLGTRPS